MSDILLQLLPHVLAALLYAALGIHFWQTRWRESTQPRLTLPMQPWERAAIFGALVAQGIGLYSGLFSAGGMRFSFSFALSLMLFEFYVISVSIFLQLTFARFVACETVVGMVCKNQLKDFFSCSYHTRAFSLDLHTFRNGEYT